MVPLAEGGGLSRGDDGGWFDLEGFCGLSFPGLHWITDDFDYLRGLE